MNLQNWKIYDKQGSNLQWSPEAYIPLSFVSTTGVNAAGYLVTNSSCLATTAKITNSGHLYDDDFTTYYKYVFDTTRTLLSPINASVYTKDISIYNPEHTLTKGISSITLDLSTKFIYPSVTYAGAIFLTPVSKGLVETEHLFILEQYGTGYIRPYDPINGNLVFKMIGDDNEIKFFTLDENLAEITWSDQLTFDVSVYTTNTPLTLNIGFRAEDAGIYERIIRIYHQIDNSLYTMGDIAVSAEAIDEDERFRTLLGNFGAPDPLDFSKLFKEVDINEDLPDYKVVNYKSKHMILEHDQIMPYIGTYKALINAIKWLGYDDIYVREWFKNVKENRKLSVVVSYDAADRTQTMLMFDADQRKTLKKLNQLSLNYCITQETGELDLWGTPITENCYPYNIKEVFVKLIALKQWLEKNIIGVNCRIIDITGEGVYFERFRNLVYMTDNVGYDYEVSQDLTPYSPDESSELIMGDASIRLTFLELTQKQIKDLPYTFNDFAEYACYIYDTSICISLDDPSYLADPSLYVIKGTTISYPFIDLRDIMWRLSVEREHSVVGTSLVTNPLFIYENDIRFYNIYDTSSVFYDISTNLTILLENAYFRDPCIDVWTKSIAYSIYPDPSDNGDYLVESSTGIIYRTHDYVSLNPEPGSRLQYAYDDNYKVPLLSMLNYSFVDSSGTTRTFPNTYYLDILDGKIEMNAGFVTNCSDSHYIYINWNYDTSLEEQMITMNVEYESPRIILAQIDVSSYYWSDPSYFSGGGIHTMTFDNSIYTMHVNHIGDYNIELFAWDSYNTMFYNSAKETYPVWIKHPTIYSLIDNSCNVTCVSTHMTADEVSTLISNNRYPIYDRVIPLQGLSFKIDTNGDPYISVPSITYFQDVPEANSLNRFYNLTERVLSISGNDIVIDADYQKFYANDDIQLVKADKGKYSSVIEVSSHIANVVGTTLTLDQIPNTITIDSSSEVYLLNDTYRTTTNVTNTTTNLVLDVSGYVFDHQKHHVFDVGQLVNVIIYDGSKSGYSWGSAYRVVSVNGSTHTFDNLLPQFVIDDPNKYTVKVKHAFSTFANFTLNTKSAVEIANNFRIYLDDTYCQEYYLDNTFVISNILFDHELVNERWYDSSNNNLHYTTFYYHKNYVIIDTSTLVILRAVYDPSNYMLRQKNIWTVVHNDTSTVAFKVFNDDVPYIFNASDYYSISVESYDMYGNLIKTE